MAPLCIRVGGGGGTITSSYLANLPNDSQECIFTILEVYKSTVEPRYNENLGTMKITLFYQVSHYIRVKKNRNIKSWDQQNDLVRRFCYINRPLLFAGNNILKTLHTKVLGTRKFCLLCIFLWSINSTKQSKMKLIETSLLYQVFLYTWGLLHKTITGEKKKLW